MPLERTFIRYFTHEDLVDVGFTKEGPRLMSFRLNYRARIAGAWHQVVRYDTAHGQRLHIHWFWPPHHGAKEYLEKEPSEDYSVALEETLRDLEDNWGRYRTHVERAIRQRLEEEA